MRSKPLLILARLERQGLNGRRQALAACERELADARDALGRLDSSIAGEMALSWTLPGGARLGSAFLGGVGMRRAALQERIVALGARHGEALRDVRAQAGKLKQITLLAERARMREDTAAMRKEGAVLDEQAALRHGYGVGGP